MAGRRWWGVHAHSWHAWRVSLAELLCTLSLYQQHDGGGGCGKQRYCLIMPGFCHVYPIDLEQPANSVSDHHPSTPCHFKHFAKHPKGPHSAGTLFLLKSLFPKALCNLPHSFLSGQGTQAPAHSYLTTILFLDSLPDLFPPSLYTSKP